MTISHSTALASALASATTRITHGNAKSSAFGSTGLRFRCKRDANAAAADPWATGTEFINIGMAGPLTVNSSTGAVSLGVLSGSTTRAAADLSTGVSIFRVVDSTGNIYLSGTIGLPGSGRDLIMSASPAANSGFSIVNASILAPSTLPLGGATSTGLPATLTVENTSASAIGADYIPPMIGHPFKKSNVPSGQYPKFALADGTNVPYTMFGKTTWADGSLKFASFLLRVPAALAGSASVALTVTSTATAPATTSARTLADLSSGSLDLNVTVAGLDNLSGTWVSSLNQGITDADDILVYGDGACGKVWRVRQQFMQSGANHGQLECYWYIAALQNAAGGLYGIRYLGRVTQPWFDIDTPAKTYRAFSSLLIKNGAATVRDAWAGHSDAKSFTYAGSGNSLACTAHGFESQTLVRAAGTTLPTGLTAGTSYFINAEETPNAVRIQATTEFYGGSPAVALSGTASGDFTLTGYPHLTHFGSLWTCGASARWDYVQAGGTVASDATVRVQHDSAYWQTSGLVPAYEAVTPTAQTAFSYFPMTMGPVQRATGGTGERDDIGILPAWYVRHLLSQRAIDEQVVRVAGLAQGHAAIAVYSNATKTIKPLNAGTYAGMPAASATFRWDGTTGNTNGFTSPTGNSINTGLGTLSFDHQPALAAYALMVTGEPQYMDLMIEFANLSVMIGYGIASVATAQLLSAERNVVVGANTYSGAVSMNFQPRASAWATRDIAYAAALVPDSAPQCATYKAYFNDLNNGNFAAMKDYTDNVAPLEWRTLGLMQFNGQPVISPWMVGYYVQSMAQNVRMTENANALYMLNHAAKWFTSVYTSQGAWHTTAYRAVVRSAASGGNYVTSMAGVAHFGTNPSPTWTTGTNVFTIAAQVDGWTLANGDILMWDDQETTTPAGLTACVPYFVVGKSGNNFQLSLTAGGAAVAVSTSGSGLAYVHLAATPASGVIGNRLDPDGYISNMRGALKLAQSAGATVSTALIAEYGTRGANAIDYATNQKYNFATGA
jgi:hypothetical protein